MRSSFQPTPPKKMKTSLEEYDLAHYFLRQARQFWDKQQERGTPFEKIHVTLESILQAEFIFQRLAQKDFMSRGSICYKNGAI